MSKYESKYVDCVATCACGATFDTKSTKKEINVYRFGKEEKKTIESSISIEEINRRFKERYDARLEYYKKVNELDKENAKQEERKEITKSILFTRTISVISLVISLAAFVKSFF